VTPYDYVKIFGKWSAAAERAFGKPPPFPMSPTPPSDADYIVKACETFGVSTQRQYFAARNAHPDLVPSSRQVRRLWGSFGNLFWACSRQSAKRTLAEYLALERRLGHIPSAHECRAAHLDLTPLRRIMGSKWTLDGLLDYRQRLNISDDATRFFSGTSLPSTPAMTVSA